MPGTCMPAYDLWLRLARKGHRLIWMEGDILSFSRVGPDSWFLTRDVSGLLEQLGAVRRQHPTDMCKAVGYTRYHGHSEPNLRSSVLYHESADPSDIDQPPPYAYTEADAVETQTYRWEKRLHFQLMPDRPYRSLRFDPLDRPVRIRIDKVTLRHRGRRIPLKPSFVGNGKSDGKGVWHFETDDPSIIFRFPGHRPVWIDECLIDFEWLDDLNPTLKGDIKGSLPDHHPPQEPAGKATEDAMPSEKATQAPSLECGIRIPFSFPMPPGLPAERLAVLCHAFHPELMPEIREYLGNIPSPFDIFLTTDTETKIPAIQDAFQGWSGGRVETKVFENRGRDIAPKLLAWSEVYRDYGLMLHIHSKKTDYNSYLQRWRTYIFRNLVGSKKNVADILSLFANDGRLGLVAPMHHHALNIQDPYGSNLADMKSLAGRMGVDLDRLRHLDFPAGSMFWARTAALRPLLESGLRHSDFPDEMGQKDGTIAHAVERLFLVSCEAAGFHWTKVVCNDNYPETAYAERIRSERMLLERLQEQWQLRRMLPEDGTDPVASAAYRV